MPCAYFVKVFATELVEKYPTKKLADETIIASPLAQLMSLVHRSVTTTSNTIIHTSIHVLDTIYEAMKFGTELRKSDCQSH